MDKIFQWKSAYTEPQTRHQERLMKTNGPRLEEGCRTRKGNSAMNGTGIKRHGTKKKRRAKCIR